MTTGAGSAKGCAPVQSHARRAASRSAAHAADGEMLSAAKYDMLRLVSTVCAHGTVAVASAIVVRSPLTSVTGTPYAPATAALIVSSPIGLPLSLHSNITRGLYVWPIT